jgi:hypothetical protein
VNRPFAFTALPLVLSLALIACGGPINSVPVNGAAPSATPIPGPSATPTPPPPGVLSVNPASLTLIGIGASDSQQIGVVETAYTQAFGVTSTCANIATVMPLTGTGPSLSVTVTGLANGSCSVTITDVQNQAKQVAVTVSTAGISLQSVGDGR